VVIAPFPGKLVIRRGDGQIRDKSDSQGREHATGGFIAEKRSSSAVDILEKESRIKAFLELRGKKFNKYLAKSREFLGIFRRFAVSKVLKK
jgi:hypothetical protein